MNIKSKGTRYERDLVDALYEAGFGVIRAPSSGGATSRELPDIVAGNGKIYLAIEVKFTKELPLYIRAEQIEDLIEFSKRFGAKPLVAVKLPRREWRFVRVDMLQKTARGKRYKLDGDAYVNGLTFSELVRRCDRGEDRL